jgi:hypothetical protein
MDRAPHERRLNDRAALERGGQRSALEPLEPRPQADVHRRRVLGLDPGDPLERPRQRHPAALEQQLAGEQRPVELPLGERAHGANHRRPATSVGRRRPAPAGDSSRARRNPGAGTPRRSWISGSKIRSAANRRCSRRRPAPPITCSTSCGRRSSPAVWRRVRRCARRTWPERLGVSRMPVREAIKRLHAEGLVEVLPSRRVRVAALSSAEIEDIYDMRVPLEPLAVRLAVPQLTRPGSAMPPTRSRPPTTKRTPRRSAPATRRSSSPREHQRTIPAPSAARSGRPAPRCPLVREEDASQVRELFSEVRGSRWARGL